MVELPSSRSGQTAEQVARTCAAEAGRLIMDRFRGGLRREQMVAKGRGNFVTETDVACEQLVLDILSHEYGDMRVLSEETAPPGLVDRTDPGPIPEGWLWVVDPLDGTHNFSQGIPQFAFNIALCHNREPVLGLTYAPATGDEFFAQAGAGLFVNGSPGRVSDVGSLSQSVWGMDLGYNDIRAGRLIELVAEIWPGVQAVRVIGSAALGLAYAASGRYDLFVHHFVYPWDIAPGIVMVREAGGTIVDRDGGPITLYSEGVVAGSPAPVRELLEHARGKPWRE